MVPPTFVALKKELALRRTQLSSLHQEMEHDDNFIHAAAVWGDRAMVQYFRGLDPNGQLLMLSIADDVITTGLSQYVIGEHPSVEILLPRKAYTERPGDKRAREKHVRRLQDALEALLWQAETYSTETPVRTAGYHMLGLGLGVIGYPILWDRFPKHPMKSGYGEGLPYRKPEAAWNALDRKHVSEFERRRAAALPLDFHAVHPRRVYFDIESDPPEDVIIQTNVLPGMYLQRYPHLEAVNSRGKTARYTIYCSREHYGLWLNDQPLLTSKEGANADGFAKNRTGILWYRMARGGFGNQGFGNEWQYAIQGIVRGMRSLIVSKTIDYNVMGIMRQVYGIPPFKIKAETIAEGTAAARRLHFGMGQVFIELPNELLSKIETPDVPAVVFQEMGETDRLIERHTWSDVMRGANPASETASGSSQRLSQGQASLATERSSLQNLLSGMLQDICHMTKYEFREPLELLSRDQGLVTLNPDDILDGMRIRVNSRPATPEEKMMDRRESIALIDARLRSRHTTLIQDPDVTDPEEELARIAADAAQESEMWIQSIAAEALGMGVEGGGGGGGAAPARSPLDQGGTQTQPLVAPSEIQPGGSSQLPELVRQ